MQFENIFRNCGHYNAHLHYLSPFSTTGSRNHGSSVGRAHGILRHFGRKTLSWICTDLSLVVTEAGNTDMAAYSFRVSVAVLEVQSVWLIVLF